MARVLVFNLSAKFDLGRFARQDAIDLYRSESKVSLFDATNGGQDDFADMLESWPKKMDSRAKSIADEILDHVRAAVDFRDQVIAFYIVDDALEILPPGEEGAPTPTAQAAVELVERVLESNQDIHNTRVVHFGICLSGHLIEKQRQAVSDYYDSGLSNVEGLFFFEGVYQNRNNLPETGTRFLIDLMVQRGSTDDGITSIEKRSDFAFVVKMDDGLPTVSAAMRHDFCSFVQKKIASGFDESQEAARSSKDFLELKEKITESNDKMAESEGEEGPPIEAQFDGPMSKAPYYKTVSLMAEIDARAHEFESQLRSAAQHRIESEVSLSKVSEVDGLRVEKELKALINDITLPPMQFRTSLLNVIQSDLYPQLNQQLLTAEGKVTELRKALAGYFTQATDGAPEQEQEVIRPTAKFGPQDVDLSQLQNVVSSAPYWVSHQRFLQAVKRLPSRPFAYAICILPLLAMWAMAYAFLFGALVTKYEWWEHLALLVPVGTSSDPTYHQPIVFLAVSILMLIGVNWVFSGLRRKVRAAHGTYLEQAEKMESDFRELALMAEEYRRRARILQMRKAFMMKLDQSLNKERADKFNRAVKMLELRRSEIDGLTNIGDQTERYRAKTILDDEKQSLGWIQQYFTEKSEFAPAPVEIKVSDTVQVIEVKKSPFLVETKVHFDVLRDWER